MHESPITHSDFWSAFIGKRVLIEYRNSNNKGCVLDGILVGLEAGWLLVQQEGGIKYIMNLADVVSMTEYHPVKGVTY